MKEQIMTKDELVKILKGIKEVQSRTGLTYKIQNVTNASIFFKRSPMSDLEKLSLEELLALRNSNKPINTTMAKEYISGRKQSPAVAIIDELTKHL